jgi:hypothetical protein
MQAGGYTKLTSGQNPLASTATYFGNLPWICNHLIRPAINASGKNPPTSPAAEIAAAQAFTKGALTGCIVCHARNSSIPDIQAEYETAHFKTTSGGFPASPGSF